MLDQVSGKQGKVEYKVKLPQVTGDKAAARDRFNEGMRTALDDTVRGLDDAKLTKPATIGDGQLQAQESSRVSFIGPHVLTGVAVFLTNSGGPYPSHRVATITINTDTAQPIMFGEVFADQGPPGNVAARTGPGTRRSGSHQGGRRHEIGAVPALGSGPEGIDVLYLRSARRRRLCAGHRAVGEDS